MADKKITELTELTAPVNGDLVAIVDDPAGTPITKKVTRENLLHYGFDGWIAANETWTYASADAPTFTFTISGDKTGKYSAGMRIKLTQTTVKYFIITKVVFDDPGSTITVYGGTDYTLVDAAITNPYYSTQKAPLGFPLDPTKWTVKVSDTTLRTQATPTGGAWYNLGSVSISIPIGVWNVDYQVLAQIAEATAGPYTLLTTLSTANNAQSDSEFTTRWHEYNSANLVVTNFKTKVLTLTSKTAYYINTMVAEANIDNIYNPNHLVPLVIRAVCAYL